MVRKCGCGYYYYPLPPGAEYCNYNKQPAWGKSGRLLACLVGREHLPTGVTAYTAP